MQMWWNISDDWSSLTALWGYKKLTIIVQKQEEPIKILKKMKWSGSSGSSYNATIPKIGGNKKPRISIPKIGGAKINESMSFFKNFISCLSLYLSSPIGINIKIAIHNGKEIRNLNQIVMRYHVSYLKRITWNTAHLRKKRIGNVRQPFL